MSEKVESHPEPGDVACHCEIVPDGVKYGIALKGRIILHGMEWGHARKTLEILNSALNPAPDPCRFDSKLPSKQEQFTKVK